MSDLPTRPIVVELPPAVYNRLAELASDAPVEDLAAAMLAKVVAHGSPGELHQLLRLMTEVADLQSNEWDERRAKLHKLRA